jgi:transcriptional regulator with XRE-family HTH domain
MQSHVAPRLLLLMQLPRLREQRLQRGLSQEELARLAGLSRKTVGEVEAGRQAWPRTAAKLAKALRVKIPALQ